MPNSQDDAIEATSEAGDKNISEVRVKTPPFWRENVTLWILHAESQFYTCGITTDAAKFHCLVSAMDHEALGAISDILTSPPKTKKYEALTEALKSRFQESEERRLTRLLTGLSLGDKKPTTLLHQIKQLAGPALSDSKLIRTMWLQHLPPQVTAILAGTGNLLPLNEQAETADRIVETLDIREIHAVQRIPGPSANNNNNNSKNNNKDGYKDSRTDDIAELRAELRDLSKKVQTILRITRKDNRSKSHNRGRSSDRDEKDRDICYYHARYKDAARTCVQPCNFQAENSNSTPQ